MEYFEHKGVRLMFAQNAQFYEETCQSEYDILRFARKMLRGRWCGESVVRFLAFGLCGYSKREILKTLEKELPTWRALFTWQVLCWEVEGLL